MKKILIISFAIALIASGKPGYSLSNAAKSQNDYVFTLNVLRNVKIMVDNFPSDAVNTKYKELQTMFQSAAEDHYGDNFDSSYSKFTKLKIELYKFLESIGQSYLNRTKEILDSTSKTSLEILLKYSKQGGNLAYFKKPYDPLLGVKTYEPREYHLYHDKETIERYLNNGFKKYNEAKNIYEDPELKILKNRKRIQSEHYNVIIEKHMNVIMLCRLSKQYGIEIHKIININDLDKIQKKYNISAAGLVPIFDDRIPESYKVDANDNVKLTHLIEKQRVEKYMPKNSSDEQKDKK